MIDLLAPRRRWREAGEVRGAASEAEAGRKIPLFL